MSYVTSMILTTSGVEHDYRNGGWLVDRLNGYLMEHHERTFVPVDERAGGDKGFQARVYLVAINYLHLEKFLEVLHGIPWELPGMVTLLVNQENDEGFSVYRPQNYQRALPRMLVADPPSMPDAQCGNCGTLWPTKHSPICPVCKG